jgi:hypothetical protein
MLVGNPLGKYPLVRPRSRWVGSIKMDFKETFCECGVFCWNCRAQQQSGFEPWDSAATEYSRFNYQDCFAAEQVSYTQIL